MCVFIMPANKQGPCQLTFAGKFSCSSHSDVGQSDKVYGAEHVFLGGSVFFTVSVMADVE